MVSSQRTGKVCNDDVTPARDMYISWLATPQVASQTAMTETGLLLHTSSAWCLLRRSPLPVGQMPLDTTP